MADTKSPISLDPFTEGDGAPGRIPGVGANWLHNPRIEATLHNPVGSWAHAGPVQVAGRSGRICAPRVHNERAKRETALSGYTN
jgi:hypothetical protein